ncbi:MAG: hypothetical protein E7470_04900 [Ruminococcaceae bacterium]|nr:hypothetical protein [Oscillospiraceae bacterium]
MKRKIAVIFLSMILALITAGCAHLQRPSETEAYRVVTQIDVRYQKDRIVSEGSFFEPEKMQKILYYLRSISPYGTPAEDPAQIQGSDFFITLRYSDNTQKVYQQRDNRFMRIDSGPWKRIDPKRAIMLSQILDTMDSDTNSTTIPVLTSFKQKEKADANASAFLFGAGDEARLHFRLRQKLWLRSVQPSRATVPRTVAFEIFEPLPPFSK